MECSPWKLLRDSGTPLWEHLELVDLDIFTVFRMGICSVTVLHLF